MIVRSTLAIPDLVIGESLVIPDGPEASGFLTSELPLAILDGHTIPDRTECKGTFVYPSLNHHCVHPASLALLDSSSDIHGGSAVCLYADGPESQEIRFANTLQCRKYLRTIGK